MGYGNVFGNAFKAYGRILEGYDFTELVRVLKQRTPLPEQGFEYLASSKELEALEVAGELKNRAFGGMEMQLGYCNGYNDVLNCLEYHNCSELCITAEDIVLFLGQRRDIDAESFLYDTAGVEAFYVPAGIGIELYATTLHYAPCNIHPERGYHVANGLLLGTNGNCPAVERKDVDQLLAGCNKWLLAHSEAPEAKRGAFVGLIGENLRLDDFRDCFDK